MEVQSKVALKARKNDPAKPLLWRHFLPMLLFDPTLDRGPLTDGQFDALVSFSFNLGSGALQRSTLRRKVNREEHADVPPEFMRWVWAGGRTLKGLIRRRQAETILYARPFDPIGTPTLGPDRQLIG